jgi:hypothetical protein
MCHSYEVEATPIAEVESIESIGRPTQPAYKVYRSAEYFVMLCGVSYSACFEHNLQHLDMLYHKKYEVRSSQTNLRSQVLGPKC